MTTPDAPSAIPELESLSRARGDGPVFRAPWEAQAFAMAVALNQRGVFTWKEWADALTRAIRDARAAGDPDLGDTYYVHWLTALERIAGEKRLIGGAEFATRCREWEDAAKRMPHGKPILLRPEN